MKLISHLFVVLSQALKVGLVPGGVRGVQYSATANAAKYGPSNNRDLKEILTANFFA